MPLQVGRLDRRVEIIRVTFENDDYGQPVPTETVLKKVPAMVWPTKFSERFESGRDMATKVNTFRIRYFDDLLATDFIRYNGDKYAIRGIAPRGTRNREFLDILGEAFETAGL